MFFISRPKCCSSVEDVDKFTFVFAIEAVTFELASGAFKKSWAVVVGAIPRFVPVFAAIVASTFEFRGSI
jgi:hypothetical protein